MPLDFEATSLRSALEGDAWTPREHVFCEQAGDVNLTGCEFITMVRSKRHKLVHFKGQTYGQLFDLERDPAEVDNRWDDAGYQGIRQQLLDLLRDWLIESNYQTRDWMAAAR